MSRKQSGTFALYTTILLCALFFFLLGVYVGNRLADGRPAAAEPEAQASELVDDPRTKLDFYEEMQGGSEGEPAPEEGSGPDSEESGPEIVVDPGPAGRPPPPASEGGSNPGRSESSGEEQGTEAGVGERYTIQVAALKTAAEARQVLIRLKAKGYAAELVGPTSDDAEYYRVWVGSFQRADQAELLEQQLKSDDFQTYLKKVDASRIGR